jgi:hypothetical protein
MEGRGTYLSHQLRCNAANKIEFSGQHAPLPSNDNREIQRRSAVKTTIMAEALPLYRFMAHRRKGRRCFFVNKPRAPVPKREDCA